MGDATDSGRRASRSASFIRKCQLWRQRGPSSPGGGAAVIPVAIPPAVAPPSPGSSKSAALTSSRSAHQLTMRSPRGRCSTVPAGCGAPSTAAPTLATKIGTMGASRVKIAGFGPRGSRGSLARGDDSPRSSQEEAASESSIPIRTGTARVARSLRTSRSAVSVLPMSLLARTGSSPDKMRPARPVVVDVGAPAAGGGGGGAGYGGGAPSAARFGGA
eukprot:1607819-Prymnesium_polylepis.1